MAVDGFFLRGGRDEEFVVDLEAIGADSVVSGVVLAVAAVKDRPIGDLEPLAWQLDPDALQQLVARGRSPAAAPLDVTFEYEGCRVTIESGHVIRLRPTDGFDDAA